MRTGKYLERPLWCAAMLEDLKLWFIHFVSFILFSFDFFRYVITRYFIFHILSHISNVSKDIFVYIIFLLRMTSAHALFNSQFVPRKTAVSIRLVVLLTLALTGDIVKFCVLIHCGDIFHSLQTCCVVRGTFLCQRISWKTSLDYIWKGLWNTIYIYYVLYIIDGMVFFSSTHMSVECFHISSLSSYHCFKIQ